MAAPRLARTFAASLAPFAFACLLASGASAQAPGRIFRAQGNVIGLPGAATGFVQNDFTIADLDFDGRPDLVGAGTGLEIARNLGGDRFAPFQFYFRSRGNFESPVVGDFDGDGRPDVAAINALGPNDGPPYNLFVGYGDGHAGFADSFSVATPFNRSLAAADLNGDGLPDFVVVNPDSDSVGVYLAHANRTCSLAGAYRTRGAAWALQLGEVTGSGGLDLVVSESDSGFVSVFPGNGDGSFGARQDHPLAVYAFGFALANFDAQPGLDLLAATTFSQQTVASGDGAGWFGPLSSLPQEYPTAFLLAADLNRDGHADVLSVDLLNAGFRASTIHTWLGDGSGGFSGPITSKPWGYATVGPAATAELNGDGIPDLVVPAWTTRLVCLADGRGDGSFGAARVNAEIPVRFKSTTAGDFDEDGHADAIASVTDQTLAFAHGNGDGTFAPFAISPATGLTFDLMTAGKFDADNHLDLVGIVLNPPTLAFLRGHGDGTFDAPVSFALGATPQIPTVADVNGDGRPDVSVACTGANAIYVALAGAGGLAAPVPSPAPAGPVAVRYRDLDGDGKLDRVLACTGQMVVQLGDGAGGFATLASYPQTFVGDVELADLDEDGVPDAVLSEGANAPPTVHVRKGLPGGAFGPESLVSLDWIQDASPYQGHSRLGKLDLLDLDGDGHLDVVASDLTLVSAIAARGRGDGTFEFPDAYANPYGAGPTTIVDLNEDGRPDVVQGAARVTATTPDFAYASNVFSMMNRTGGITAVSPPDPRRGGAAALAIASVAPNPSRGRVSIALTAAEAGTARLALYAPAGREVYAREGVALAAGPNTVALDAGERLPAGVYWLRASTRQGASAVRKVVLLGR